MSTAITYTSTTRRNHVAVDLETLKRSARTILWNCGLHWSPNRIARLCLRYDRDRTDGFDFFDYVATSAQLDFERRATLLADPGVASVITWADPTGELAVRRVVDQRGF